MRARWNEADRALRVAPARVVATNRKEAGELTLTAGVGLQAHRVVTGDFAHHALEFADELGVAPCVAGWRVWVDVGEFRPRNGNHFRRGVQLHGARAERDHRAIERQVFVGKTT